MGLFEFIRKKKSGQTIEDGLTLEKLLKKALSEPAFRAEFYKRLLADDLVVLTKDMNLNEGNYILQQDTSVNIVSFPDGKIPIFTSTERIFDKGVVKEQVEFLQMKGENIFGLAKGATFLLNPYSDYFKELSPDEIEKILNGTILTDTLKTLTIEKETKVKIGQPAKYPTDIVNSLRTLFSERTYVKAAYLGWILKPNSGEPPHYIFALDVEGDDFHSLTQEAGFTAKQYLEEHEFVDFIKIDGNGGICDYFLKQTKPFYER